MLALRAWSRRSRYRCVPIRDGKQSSGIQLAPLANSGVPLTTNVNAEPKSSSVVSSSMERNPTRRDQVSRGAAGPTSRDALTSSTCRS
jgi:hypothetical protein